MIEIITITIRKILHLLERVFKFIKITIISIGLQLPNFNLTARQDLKTYNVAGGGNFKKNTKLISEIVLRLSVIHH